MTKSNLKHAPNYYDTYINQVADVPLQDAFLQSLADLDAFDMPLWKSIGEKVYAPQKWTIADILRHLSDWERIFGFRALLATRNMGNPFESYDENEMVRIASATKTPLEALVADLKSARMANIALFKSFDDSDVQKPIVIGDTQISVLAMGYIMVGHQNHHFKVMQEKYASLKA
jgi:hypothetical protein